MNTISFSTVIDVQAPPHRVLEVLFDVERWSEWTSTVTGVRRMDSLAFGVGSRARVQQPKLRAAVWQVTELDTKGFTWVTRSPGLRITGRHYVEENELVSRVTLSLEFSGFLSPLAARLYGNLTKQYLATEAHGLKKRSEARPSEHQTKITE
jgi:hypothetical protein